MNANDAEMGLRNRLEQIQDLLNLIPSDRLGRADGNALNLAKNHLAKILVDMGGE